MVFLGHNQAKLGQFYIVLGCGLPNSAAILRILRQFCGGRCHTSFFASKSPFFGLKKLKICGFWQKILHEYFGFSPAILRKILKGQNPSPKGQDCLFERSQHTFEVLQALSPLTRTEFACSSSLMSFWCCYTHPTTKKQSLKLLASI